MCVCVCVCLNGEDVENKRDRRRDDFSAVAQKEYIAKVVRARYTENSSLNYYNFIASFESAYLTAK